ncbi:MAG: bifunctional tetrahydrofolate synthase/dihydrofolate synthase [Gammaproteobacteria bacterium]|nr:bifunctional tetrahydrofolate synthase/dihydrofolate synthase [Gammaproteobacteria bacterium]
MNLSAWLAHIATVHPCAMELGLERVRTVAEKMGLARPAPFVFTIAGTNGKGSTLAAIEAILLGSGLRTGSYMSPHLERYNERIRLGGIECEDEAICAALAEVEQARDGVSLSYFEFSTLAALNVFAGERLDALLLEVGLGGRLDAVNIIDADVALITNIELDHQEWLGGNRELIGAEKAGILRPGAPLIYCDVDPPASVTKRAGELGAPVYRHGSDFGASIDTRKWSWWGRNADGEVQIGGLEKPGLPLASMSAALQAVHLSPLPLSEKGIRGVQLEAGLPGRLESCRDRAGGLPVLLDVSHNPAAARLLSDRIAEFRTGREPRGKVAAVLAALADKDIEGMAAALSAQVDVWYIAEVEDSRGMAAAELRLRLTRSLPGAAISAADSVASAYRQAVDSGSDLVVVTGSFHTVAAVRPLTTAGGSPGH